MTWLDRAISWVSPTAGLERARARAALKMVRAYEGASIGRRTSGWRTTGASANAEISGALPRLRARSRDQVRNNPYARRAIAALVGNAVGTGITLGINNAQGAAVWKKWAREADFHGDCDIFGLEALIGRAMFESGDCLVVRVRTSSRNAGKSGVPLRIKVLEGDFLDVTKNGPIDGGNYVIAGIEIDNEGRRVAYWIYTVHPGEVSTFSMKLTSVRVLAEDVIYCFEKERPGQILGVPRLAASIMRIRDLDEYQEALLVKKKIEACFAAFVSSPDDDRLVGTGTDTDTSIDGKTRRVERFSPGQILYGKPGEEITFGQPSAGADVGFVADELRAIAVGAGCTYEQLTGDLSRVNYSSYRGGRAEFKILIEQFRWLTFVPQVCERIYDWFEEAAFLAGKIRTTELDHVWTPPRWEYVNPIDDVRADKEELAAGLVSHSAKIRERGEDPDAVISEIESDRKKLAEKGITVDYGIKGGAPGDTVGKDDGTTTNTKTDSGGAGANTLAENSAAMREMAGSVRALAAAGRGPDSITVNAPPVTVNMPSDAIRVQPTVHVHERDIHVNVQSPRVEIIEKHPTTSTQTIERDNGGEILKTTTRHEFEGDS